MSDSNFIDEIMGIDPAEVVNAFQNSSSNEKSSGNPNVYKTNPKNSVSEDGNYHSRVRVLYNPYDYKRSIVHQARYAMKDENGFFQAISSLSIGNKECPIFKAWKKIWFTKMHDPSDPTKLTEDPSAKAWAKQMFSKSESDWVLIQIIEDENQPELVGQFKLMKLPKAILNRMQAKMNPTDPKKVKQPIMDYLFGPCLEMNVVPGPDDPVHPERKQREIAYDLCDFDTDPQPIIKVDGTQFFTDEELELIDTYNSLNNEYNKAKTQAKKDEAARRKSELVDQIRPLYSKTIDYIRTYGLDPEKECGYKPWNDELALRVNNWITKVLNMVDPSTGASTVNFTTPTKTQEVEPVKQAQTMPAPQVVPSAPAYSETDDDLPF